MELLFSRDFLDRYNRYTKHQTTFPKEQESRNEFLTVLNYNPFSHTYTYTTHTQHSVISLLRDTVETQHYTTHNSEKQSNRKKKDNRVDFWCIIYVLIIKISIICILYSKLMYLKLFYIPHFNYIIFGEGEMRKTHSKTVS